MRRSLYASTAIHAAILLWVAFGESLFRGSPETEFEVTGVTILSVSEFEALTAGVEPTPDVLETPVAPPQAEESAAPDPPTPERGAAPGVEQPEEAPEPSAKTRSQSRPRPRHRRPRSPTRSRPCPTPSGAPDLPPSDTPTPREAAAPFAPGARPRA